MCMSCASYAHISHTSCIQACMITDGNSCIEHTSKDDQLCETVAKMRAVIAQ